MKRTNIAHFSMAMGLAAAFAVSTAVAKADAWDKKTTVSFSQTVEVPGYVLQPGKYVMKLIDSSSDRHIVQFTNERGNHVYAAAQSINAYRKNITSKTVITFYEARAGQPEPMRTWFYPGDEFGQEFVYPKQHLAEIAAVTRTTTNTRVAAAETSPAVSTTAIVEEPVKETETAAVVAETPVSNNYIAEEKTEVSAPVEIAQADTPKGSEPVPSSNYDLPAAPTELPRTASPMVEIGLVGLVFVTGAIAARKARIS
jgi:hypothetical protein